MDWCSAPRLKLMLLIASTNIICLHGNPATGVDHNLHCVNDYLFTINCSLSLAPSENTFDSNTSYWLTFTETYEKSQFVCMLTNSSEDYFCSFKTSQPIDDYDFYADTFEETDIFGISLCRSQSNGSEICELLDEEYRPKHNIKPNAPCCLAVSHNSSQHHFTWNTAYEHYGPYFTLTSSLKYQLHFYKRGDRPHMKPREINSRSLNYSVDDDVFVPDTDYAARVRTGPDLAFYKGEWSDWSPEVHWRTPSAAKDVASNTFVSGLVKVFIPFCVMVPLILLCYAPLKKWRQSAFIPTPAPYFHSLYSDCQGDFKNWVVTQEITADMLKAEETLQIDKLTKCADVQEEVCPVHFHHQLMEGNTYSNIADPGCDASLLGVPYAVSTVTPLSAPGSSLTSLTLSSQPGSPTEGDSGCWLSSHMSLESDPPWYCNEYCTLSAFHSVTAEHPKSCTTGFIRLDGIAEA